MARSADPVLAERRRRQILDAAMACFRRRGFHQTSMQEICAEASLSAGALYRYFASKSEIISAIAEEDWRNREPFFEAVARGPDVVDALCVIAERVLEKCGGEGALVADVIAESLRDPDLSVHLTRQGDTMRRRIAMALGAAHRRGLVSLTVTPVRAAGIVILMLDGLVLRAAGLGADRARPLVDDFRVAIERLLAPAPEKPAPAKARRAIKPVVEATER